MQEFIRSWLRTIHHYITLGIENGNRPFSSDSRVELTEIVAHGQEIFGDIYKRLDALEAMPRMERLLLWQVGDLGVIAIEAYRIAITDGRPNPDNGRQHLYFVILPPGGPEHRLWLFEEWLPSRDLFHEEEEAILVALTRIENDRQNLRIIEKGLLFSRNS